jgi:hypothetical protein
MSTLPQVARCMQTVLTDEADAAGRRSGFIQRQVKLTGGTFAQTLVFGWLSNPEATLEELAQTAAVLGVQITPQGLDERFTPEAAQCLQQVLEAGLQQLVADGGRTEQRTQSSLKIQLRLNLTTGQLQGPALQAGRGSDRRSPLPADDLPAGALWLADLGYFSLDCLADLDARGVYWLMRLQVQTAVLGATGQERDVLELLQAQGQDTVDIPVRLGKDRCLPCRLLARRVSPQEAEQRRRRLKAQARDKGRMVSARRLAGKGGKRADIV